jgi:mRNA interferase MazF
VGVPAAGSVVLVPFPFSDLSRSKLRPALVLAVADRDDLVLCQITSNPYSDSAAIELLSSDFRVGGLQRTSYVRPGKLFTSSTTLILEEVGVLQEPVRDRVVDAVVAILRRPVDA